MRLIDADAYKKHLASFVFGGEKAIVKNGIGNYWIDGIHTAYREIDNVPTIKTFTLADIEENYRKGMEKGLEEARPHGEWIPYKWDSSYTKKIPLQKGSDSEWEEYWGEEYMCSICGKAHHKRRFCPHCGADMRKEGETE